MYLNELLTKVQTTHFGKQLLNDTRLYERHLTQIWQKKDWVLFVIFVRYLKNILQSNEKISQRNQPGILPEIQDVALVAPKELAKENINRKKRPGIRSNFG